jgi:tryptophan-rich sensory protein
MINMMSEDREENDIIECDHDTCHEYYSEEVIPWLDRVKRLDYLLVYGSILALAGAFLLSYLPGIYSEWYAGLKQVSTNPWLIRGLWVATTLISYIGLYILWKDANNLTIQKYLGISVLYLIGSFIILAWSVALYQASDIGLAVWISGILFVYQFWVFIVIWYINPKAAVFIIPLLAMYLYLVYSMIQLAGINDITL